MGLQSLTQNWKSRAAGAAMLGMSSAVALTGSASAQDVSPQQATFHNASMTRQEHPAIQAPTAKRPYYLATFDSAFKAAHPSMTPVSIEGLHPNKMVVLNFGVEGERFSGIQTEILERIIGDKAADSPKDILLVNIYIADAENNPVYASAYKTYYEQNTLVDGTQAHPESLVPYGAIYGSSLEELNGEFEQLSDFALLNGVQDDASFQESIKTIYTQIIGSVNSYRTLANKAPEKLADAGPALRN